MKTQKMLSPEPEVTIIDMTLKPLSVIVGAGRTCYSKELVFPEAVVGWDGSEGLAMSTFQAGHHTLLQHINIVFALEGISRQVIWTLLHAQPFYNSSQQSQRYVSMKEAGFVVPSLQGKTLKLYQECLQMQLSAYHQLVELLIVPAEAAYLERFSQVRASQVQKKSQEIARYVLPVATRANLYYTINFLTLLCLNRLSKQPDASLEQSILLQKMVEAVLARAPDLEIFFQEPLPKEVILEWQAFCSVHPNQKKFQEEFDRSLSGRVSALRSYQPDAERLLADAVREVLGMPFIQFGDGEAIELVLDPAQNNYLGETLNLATVSKLMRSLWHIHYVFRKRISHTADSQDQRHRTVPASRPSLIAGFPSVPDYITPILIQEDDEAMTLYRETMEKIWEVITDLLASGISREYVSYLLPNAVALRFTESGSLLHLLHKYRMRLCFNAQEEIWQTAVEEVEQIREVHPQIGKWLLPPCVYRKLAGISPPCPEGERFCGVKVWDMPLEKWQRVI